MSIPIGKEISASGSKSAVKEVDCENCSEAYAYIHTVEATAGGGGTILGLGQKSAEKAALKRLDKKLQKSLKSPMVVPCPKCGHCQKEMIPVAQNERLFWLKAIIVLAIFAGVITGGLALIAFITKLTHENANLHTFGIRRFMNSVLQITIWTLPPGIFLRFVRNRLIRRYNPNDEDAESRIAKGRELALSEAEYTEYLAHRE